MHYDDRTGPFGHYCERSAQVSKGKVTNVTSAGWQVTLCDPMWHVSSLSGVATLLTAIHLLLTYYVFLYHFVFYHVFYSSCCIRAYETDDTRL